MTTIMGTINKIKLNGTEYAIDVLIGDKSVSAAIQNVEDIANSKISTLSWNKEGLQWYWNGGANISRYSTSQIKYFLSLDSVDNTADEDKSVLSASKLTTERTIWGQSFDGTGNIDGKLTIKGSAADKKPLLEIVDNDSDQWNYLIQALSPNMASDTRAALILGKSNAKYNSGHILHRHIADGSNQNYINIRGWGALEKEGLTIRYDNHVGINTIDPTEMLHVNEGNVLADGFKTPSGTASQFLKADGSVDSNTYLTSHQDISGKADKTNTVSNVSIDKNNALLQTVNNKSTTIVTLSDVAISGSYNDLTDKPTLSPAYPLKMPAEAKDYTLDPNTFYHFGGKTELNVVFAPPIDGLSNEYTFSFDSTGDPTTLSLPSNVHWQNDLAISSNTHYEVSIKYDDGIYYGLFASWENV